MTSLIDVDAAMRDMVEKLKLLCAERNIDKPALVGIHTGGVWVARRLQSLLGWDGPVGELDISFYRDDFTRIGLNPKVKASSLPFETEGRDVVLVDDVIMSGRTIRAAMNELFDFGRPASILLVALMDVGGRDLPIQPDVVGASRRLESNQRVKLLGPAPLAVELREKTGSS
ncbi:bifunctional pyr operon transcriptional regulator/uracil phosphoribosyltransferase PyrR [Hahella sp. KA22]|uniref:bifunctional pyr operon transcriptional regulator/uracil phosphoribosyltransferase PyrR n=1 Tax=Hahella sp. KA22 TaxID=1628392 RepID=UPI000FDE303F|nr:bifunctional pyr operon transcriptional regulator/uracil phosphoribosyltransferase PyrR [Hahella sp. KA22]AZZ90074.1 bifunctional pyr operon transcriptional regulator/uracil phosphoribosyltransferase PyrR [Hahella sp. KA22]QAY53444.1 bifunctional pyr operon transcriptional regulator/uracil phosphoribosyltransferase PyrR [Hahella sp. KA22]